MKLDDDSACIDMLDFLSLTHCHFAHVRGWDMSPIEVSAGRRFTRPFCSSFGSTIMAELPDSVKEQAPNESRNVEAAFLHPGFTCGAYVQAKIRIGDQMEMKRFIARNARAIEPVEWKASLCGSFLREFGERRGDAPAAPEAPPRVVLPSQEVPSTGPPSSWARENGPTDNCFACRGLSERGSRKGKVHSAKCKARYRRWLENQRLGNAPAQAGEHRVEDAPLVPIPEGGRARNVDVEIERDTNAHGESGSGPPLPSSGAYEDPEGFVDEPMHLPDSMPAERVRNLKRPMPSTPRPEGLRRLSTKTTFVPRPAKPMTMARQGPMAAPTEGARSEEVPDEGGTRQNEYRESRKRSADVSVRDLEEEMEKEKDDDDDAMLSVSSLTTGLSWVSTGLEVQMVRYPLVNQPFDFKEITDTEFYDPQVESVVFKGDETKFKTEELGGIKVRVWRPTSAIDDTTCGSLDPDLTWQGMVQETCHLEECGTGTAISAVELEELKRAKGNVRCISCRWVTTQKGDAVRSRMVAKDIAGSNTGLNSAKQLGFSSPTPSCESVMILLGMAARRDMILASFDISHAFMHSPIGPGQNIVLRLPLSISTQSNEPVLLLLKKSLNGLRDASLRWLEHLSSSIKNLGFWSDDHCPCVFQGVIQTSKGPTQMILIAYVDDLLVASGSEEGVQLLYKTLSATVPTKATGRIEKSTKGGGTLKFLGRTIMRRSGESAIYLRVEPTYLAETYKEFNITSGAATIPDISIHFEKTDSESTKPLTSEAYSRFRRGLGRLLWLSQSRQDIKVHLSILGTAQASPTHASEKALKALLRWMFTDGSTVLRIPSIECEDLVDDPNLGVMMHGWSDASFAPFWHNKRRSITGGVLMFEGGLISCMARAQQSVTLSSCEAELVALQATCQECIGTSKLIHRILYGIHETEEEEEVVIQLNTDSLSALQLVQAKDVPRKSRHVEVRLFWLRELTSRGRLRIEFQEGSSNCADLLTKCLGSHLYLKHRSFIGYCNLEAPIGSMMVQMVGENKKIAFVELCCSYRSSLQKSCEVSGFKYAGVVENIQNLGIQTRLRDWIRKCREDGFWIHIHASTPCGTGSPLQRLKGLELTQEEITEWISIVAAVTVIYKVADSRSFELPTFNSNWKKEPVQTALIRYNMTFEARVFLCMTGVTSKGLPIKKQLSFMSGDPNFAASLDRRFGTCNHEEHAHFSEVSFSITAFYTRQLARGILNAVLSAQRLRINP